MNSELKNADPRRSPEFLRLRRGAGEAIGRFDMIADGDRVLVGLSGGADSFMLMHVLDELRRRAPVKFELIAAAFDPGFPEFGLADIADYAAQQNWRFESVGLDVASIISARHFEHSPCVLCSRLRRGLLYKLAAKLGCSRLALGHHADDAAISFLMSLFRGQGLTSMGPCVAGDGGRITVIRPLILLPEPEVKGAASRFALPHDFKCPYDSFLDAEGDRAYFRRLLGRIEKRIPDWRSLMLKSLGRVETDHLMVASGALRRLRRPNRS